VLPAYRKPNVSFPNLKRKRDDANEAEEPNEDAMTGMQLELV
jgi:hypothetical protein